MSLTDKQSWRLFDLISEHFEKAEWMPPLPGEREPEYTRRVFASSLDYGVQQIQHEGLVVRSDGVLTPQAVQLDSTNHYPDMAINYHHVRVGAIEVKFIDEALSGQAYLTAIGQGVAYASLGYNWALVVLVAKTERTNISTTSVALLNANLRKLGVHLVVVGKFTSISK